MKSASNEFGQLSEEELSDFETTNHITLPPTYRSFLLKFNGGEPVRKTVKDTSFELLYIFGMHNGDYYASLYKHIEMFAGRLPFSTFPIAADPFGNLFLMSVHPECYGYIYFWDHEGEPEIQDGHYIDNMQFVAYSFEELIARLI